MFRSKSFEESSLGSGDIIDVSCLLISCHWDYEEILQVRTLRVLFLGTIGLLGSALTIIPKV